MRFNNHLSSFVGGLVIFDCLAIINELQAKYVTLHLACLLVPPLKYYCMVLKVNYNQAVIMLFGISTFSFYYYYYYYCLAIFFLKQVLQKLLQ